MEHITTEYGQDCNLIKCTESEFWALKGFLNQIGVEIRRTYTSGDTVIFQARNGYKDWVKLFKSRSETCESIDSEVTKNLESEIYAR